MKKIIDIYVNKKSGSPVFSFEFFPPKNKEGEEVLFQTIEEIQKLHPEFISVTYGAGGSNQGRTKRWVEEIQNNSKITSMAHFTCIGASRNEIKETIEGFIRSGIKNIMALRGDLPKDQPGYKPPEDGFSYASELIEFIKSLNLDISIGAACYPEKHQDAQTLDDDIDFLKKKVDSGVDFLITQLFFENDSYYNFLKKCRAKGIDIPIVPGIMPITSFAQIERFTSMAACKFPISFIEKLQAVREDKKELLKISLDYSIRQCRELIDKGAPGIHFYTLNRSGATKEIMKALGVSNT